MKIALEVAVRGDSGAAGELVRLEWNVMPHLLTQEYSKTVLYIQVLLLLDQDWHIQDSQCVVGPWIFEPYILPLRPWSTHQLLLSCMPLLAAWYTERNCSIFMLCSKWVVEAMSHEQGSSNRYYWQSSCYLECKNFLKIIEPTEYNLSRPCTDSKRFRWHVTTTQSWQVVQCGHRWKNGR